MHSSVKELKVNEEVKSQNPVYQGKFPATVMIAGEHAVVYGYRSIVAAVDDYLEIQVNPYVKERQVKNQITLSSCSFGEVTFDLEQQPLNHEPGRFDYFFIIMKTLRQRFTLKPCHLKITRSIKSTVGLGSSSAFTCAVLSALCAFHQWNLTKKEIFDLALEITRIKSPLASGSDLAACLYGGLICYNPRTKSVQALPYESHKKITLVFTGYKTPTPEVLELLRKKKEHAPVYVTELLKKIAWCTENISLILNSAEETELSPEVKTLENLFALHHQCYEKLDLICDQMREIYKSLRNDSSLKNIKVSGSGLGDCLLAFGHTKTKHTNANNLKQQQMSFEIAPSVL